MKTKTAPHHAAADTTTGLRIDRKTIGLLRPILQEQLNAIATRYGLTITVGNGSYDHSTLNGTLTLELAVIGGDGVAETRERTAWHQYAAMLGVPLAWLDTTFTHRGTEFTITGYNPRAGVCPINATAKGKHYRFPVDLVRFCKSSTES